MVQFSRLDFSPALQEGAIFLPSLQPAYVAAISKEIFDLRGYNRPRSLHTVSKLNFLDKKNGFFHYPAALVSAGLFDLRVDPPASESAIYNIDRANTLLLADSGGFQEITGKLKAKPEEILAWMQRVAHAGMTLDAPLFAIGKNPKYRSFSDCLKQTVEWLDIFRTSRRSDFPLINVLHGRDETECDNWYAVVRRYPLEGWAFGGKLSNDLYLMLRMLVRLRDDGELDGKKFIHLFGHGDPVSACVFYCINLSLRAYNPGIRVTYDASSPFKADLFGDLYLYWTFTLGKNPARITKRKLERDISAYALDQPIPNAWSPLLLKTPVRDILSPSGEFDTLGHAMLAAHNTFIMCQANLEAVDLMNSEWITRERTGQCTKFADELIAACEIIQELWSSSSPYTYLTEHRAALERIF